MSDPIRELELAEARLASLETQLATMAELNASQRESLGAVAAQRDAANARTEAAESALRLATGSKGSTTVIMSLEVWQEHLASIDRYGTEQWNRGDRWRDWHSFAEWKGEQP